MNRAGMAFVAAGHLLVHSQISAQPHDPPTERTICDAHARQIELSFSGFLDESTTKLVLFDLAAGLMARKIAVCLPGMSSTAPLSSVSVTRRKPGAIRIEVVDSLTEKRVTRDIQLDLSRGSENANGLVIAVAVDELLRATWAELSLEPHPQADAKQRAAAPPSQPTLQKQNRAAPRHRIGVGPAVDFYPRASTFWGADLVYGFEAHRYFDLGVFVGPRFHRSRGVSIFRSEEEEGEVRARALWIALTLAVPLLRAAKIAFGPEVTFSGASVWFTGEASTSSRSGAHHDVVTQLGGGLFLRYFLKKAYVQAQTELGAPLRGLAVTDGTSRVGGVYGFSSQSGINVGMWWP